MDVTGLFPEVLAVPPAGYAVWTATRFALADGNTRRSMLQAGRVRLSWWRTAGRVGLTQVEVKLPRRFMVRDGVELSKGKRKVHRPRIRVRSDAYGIVVRAKTFGQLGLVEFQAAAPYLANAWRCVRVHVAQDGPGRLLVRGIRRDPLAEPTTLVPTGQPPTDLDRWDIGTDEWAENVAVRSSGVSGVVVAGLAGYGKTSLVNRRICDLAPSPAVQFVVIDGKGGPDYDDIAGRCWLFGKDDLASARDILAEVHGHMVDRQRSIRSVLGVKNMWHVGPSPAWPLIKVIIDEAHTFFAESKGSDKESKARAEVTAAITRLVEELVRKGRNVGIQVVLATQKSTGDAIPTRIRDNCQVAISFAQRTNEAAVAALGSDITEYPDAHPRRLQDPAYIGVASMVIEGKPGFTRVRTPYVSDTDTARAVAATEYLRADPRELLHHTTPTVAVRIPGQRQPATVELT